jgi:hypothetical protein
VSRPLPLLAAVPIVLALATCTFEPAVTVHNRTDRVLLIVIAMPDGEDAEWFVGRGSTRNLPVAEQCPGQGLQALDDATGEVVAEIRRPVCDRDQWVIHPDGAAEYRAGRFAPDDAADPVSLGTSRPAR